MRLPPEKVRQRIRQLHALIGSPYANEAENARRMLAKLLSENGLTWNDLPTVLADTNVNRDDDSENTEARKPEPAPPEYRYEPDPPEYRYTRPEPSAAPAQNPPGSADTQPGAGGLVAFVVFVTILIVAVLYITAQPPTVTKAPAVSTPVATAPAVAAAPPPPVAAPPPRKRTAAGVLRSVGLFGTFAKDCGQGPDPENVHLHFTVQQEELVMIEDRSTERLLFRITKAEDRNGTVNLIFSMPPTYEVDMSIVLLANAGRFRYWSATAAGRTFVEKGIVTSRREPTKWLVRCSS